MSDRRLQGPNPDLWQSATPLGTIDRGRPGGPDVERYRLYRVTPGTGAPAVLLPVRGP